MDAMAANVGDPAIQPGNLLCCFAVAPRTLATARLPPRQVPQLLQRRLQGSRVRYPLDDLTVTVGDGGEHPPPDIDPDTRIRVGDTGLLGTSHQHAKRSDEPGSFAGYGDRQYPCPPFGQETVQAAGVLMHPDTPDP